ncbi:MULTISPECIES: hypothetical protein [Bacillus]|uniref:Uncharacterized protein n=1 Tax=Bacillus pseudomycoides TaxID=64104 RepID=A0A1Y3MHV0_9BACI|nr:MULTISPECIES: hypothetical protein [Bacillus cereus group]EOP60385.1 hypothetical protein IIW_04477 [Bacillus cereus VD136]EOP71152.1 hypothetical protein KOW_04815 [Bacillus cereus VDM006]EOQ05956.1 hypothetical protein KOY_03972 [Bacillus cereus VDM021]OOG91624.1 hypothetical protein BTH41_01396 [Bacillus mycoides]EEM06684.1 hypothetical protein bmyco0002_8170 [Bacillus pseudomycoides]
MSYDTVSSLQRMQRLQQAATGQKDVLKRVNSGLEIVMFITGVFLALSTFTLSFWIYFFYFLIKEYTAKTYLVKNMDTGEKFRVDKQEFKQYKKVFRAKEVAMELIS